MQLELPPSKQLAQRIQKDYLRKDITVTPTMVQTIQQFKPQFLPELVCWLIINDQLVIECIDSPVVALCRFLKGQEPTVQAPLSMCFLTTNRNLVVGMLTHYLVKPQLIQTIADLIMASSYRPEPPQEQLEQRLTELDLYRLRILHCDNEDLVKHALLTCRSSLLTEIGISYAQSCSQFARQRFISWVKCLHVEFELALAVLVQIDRPGDTFIQQQYCISQMMQDKPLITIVELQLVPLIEDLIELKHRLVNARRIVDLYLRCQLLTYQNDSFRFNEIKIAKLLQIFPRYQQKLISHLFCVDRIKASQLLIKLSALQSLKQYRLVHDETLLPLLISKAQLHGDLAKYLLQSIKTVIDLHKRHFLTLNICVHLIECISDRSNEGIYSLLHQIFIAEREVMIEIVYRGFPHASKLVDNVEAFHVLMLNAEELINNCQDKTFIFQLFKHITAKYKNERSQQIQDHLQSLSSKYPIHFRPVTPSNNKAKKQEIVRVF